MTYARSTNSCTAHSSTNLDWVGDEGQGWAFLLSIVNIAMIQDFGLGWE